MKADEHAIERDGMKVEEIRENDVTYLPPPKPMPEDEDGDVLDTRLPKDLASCTTKTVDFLEVFQRVMNQMSFSLNQILT